MKYNSKTLDELCDVKIGRTPPRNQSEWFNSGASDDWKWVSIKDMGNCGKFITTTSETITDKAKETFNYATVASGTILLSFKLTLGRVVICDGEFVTNEAIAQLPIKDPSAIDRDYLYYYLKNYNWSNIGSTSSIATAVNSKMVKGIKIDFPDLETQKKIVRILSALDQKIELNKRISNNLLHISHQIYINDIKNIPTTKTEKLGSLCRIKYGKGLPTSRVLKDGYRVYGGNGIIGFYNEKMYEKSQVLISCRGAASGKVIFTRPDCFVTNNSLVLECEDKYHYFIKEFSLDREYYDYTTGSAQPQITIDNIKDIELSVPDDETLIRFNATLRPLEEKYFAILEENEALAKMRDILLPKLISGEINLEKIIL